MSHKSMPMADIDAARSVVSRLFTASLSAANARDAVRRSLVLQGDELHIDDMSIIASGRIFIAAIGKAAIAMTEGALSVLDSSKVSGLVITKEGHVDSQMPSAIEVFEAGHPVPDERGVEATRKLLNRLDDLGQGDVVLALISGGGSALLEAPREGILLGDLARTTELLLLAGAPIDALNAVRAPLSRVKAGGLRAAAPRSSWVTLILSDVLGNDPRVIASGPTIHNRPNPARALAVIDQYGVRDMLPRSVVVGLLDPDSDSVEFDGSRDHLFVIGDNAAAVAAAAAEAENTGLECDVVWTAMEGEASNLGCAFVAGLVDADPATDVVLGGGEATVTVRGDGRGGRNSEFALAAAIEMERRGLQDWVVASLATDGQDAMTGLAGATADGWTCQRARERGIEPEEALSRNDSAAVFDVAGGAVATGPTGTNVNDLYIAVRMHETDGRAG